MRLTLFLLAALAACGQADPSGDDTSTDCDQSVDSDADGLSDCDEADLGTDPDAADSDGDGLTDAEETDCVSDPLDADEQCYACGWPHADPGNLESTGAAEGDVIENMVFWDQCEEQVPLWDLTGEWYLLFATAEW